MKKDESFLKHLLEVFNVEAIEHIEIMSLKLIELETVEDENKRNNVIEVIMRELHSLKGAARAVDRIDIETICQRLESLYLEIRETKGALFDEVFGKLHKITDLLMKILNSTDDEEYEQVSSLIEDVKNLHASISKSETNRDSGTDSGTDSDTDSDTETNTETIEADIETFRDSTSNFEDGPPSPPVVAEPSKTPSETMAVKEEATLKAIDDHIDLKKQTRQNSEFKFLEDTHKKGHNATYTNVHSPSKMKAETIRVSASRLSSVLFESEELLSAKLSAERQAFLMKRAGQSFDVWKKEWNRIGSNLTDLNCGKDVSMEYGLDLGPGEESKSENTRKLEKLMEYLNWTNAFISDLESEYDSISKEIYQDSVKVGNMIETLLGDMKKVMMFPFSSMLELLPKVVRDIAQDRQKEVDLFIKGDDMEIDRRILEEMKDPIIHIIRNCIDHGIEGADQREQLGKPRRAQISIDISPKDQNVLVEVSDDGQGMRLESIQETLLKRGLYTHKQLEQMSRDELLATVFQSGISTSPIITEISGRGLGLTIVREKIEKLGGLIQIDTKENVGTKFSIVLPMTVATFRGILVDIKGEKFIFPTLFVQRAMRLKRQDILSVENQPVIKLGDEQVALVDTSKLLKLTGKAETELSGVVEVVVLNSLGIKMAFLVDKVINEQEVLFKNLGAPLIRVRNIAGATILGSGEAVPILNVRDLVKSAAKASATENFFSDRRLSDKERDISILISEDSITTRTLLKNILESSGYKVTAAINGEDALTHLNANRYDLVVTDVNMPKVDGFELTRRIRTNKALSHIPVVLVTSLDSREDKERGIEVGADAYIVKSSFDQSNLLDVIKSLTVSKED